MENVGRTRQLLYFGRLVINIQGIKTLLVIKMSLGRNHCCVELMLASCS